MAISLDNNKDDKENEKQQTTKVVSTKIPVEQYESFILLTEYLYKNGLIDKPTPSALLRDSMMRLLDHYHDNIENYRTIKKQSTEKSTHHHHQIITSFEKKQNLEKEPSNMSNQKDQLLQPVNDDDASVHQAANTTPVKGDEKQPEKVQDHTASLYRMDLRKFMLVLVTIDRNMKNSSKVNVYLEMAPDKEVASIIPPYSLEAWKKGQAAKKLASAAASNNNETNANIVELHP